MYQKKVMPAVTYHDGGGEEIKFMQVNGVNYPYMQSPGADQEAAILASRDTKARDNDVLLINYPKSGTHWLWEVLSMLHNGTTDTIQDIKQHAYLEALSEKQMTSIPSPRILNTHMRFEHLPEDMCKKKTKIILIHRNPKDVAASLYNHHLNMTGLYNYNGQWKNWLPLYIEGKVDSGSWFEYVRDWEQVMKDNPEHPIHLMYYEDMKENSDKGVEKMAKFLDLSVSPELCATIAKKCEFSNMVKDKVGLEDEFWTHAWRDSKPGFYRKGEVGDWKNWFTVAQNDMFDQLYTYKMDGSTLNIRFSI